MQRNADCVHASHSVCCLPACLALCRQARRQPRGAEGVRGGATAAGGALPEAWLAWLIQTSGVQPNKLPSLDHIAVQLFSTRQPTELQMEVVQGKSVELFKQFKQGNPAMKVGEGCSCQHWCENALHVHSAWVPPVAEPLAWHLTAAGIQHPILACQRSNSSHAWPHWQEHKVTEELGIWDRKFAPLASPSIMAA